jgi:hypothetical protein
MSSEIPGRGTLAFVGAFAPAAAAVGKATEIVVGLFETGSVVLTSAQPVREKIKTEKKLKLRTKEDGTKLVRVSDAIECVEEFVNGDAMAVAINRRVFDMIKEIATGGATSLSTWGELIGTPIINCIRSKALQQERERTNWRAKPSSGLPGRPKGVKNGEGGKGAIRYRMRGGPGPKF